jgi:hypothetical protein
LWFGDYLLLFFAFLLNTPKFCIHTFASAFCVAADWSRSLFAGVYIKRNRAPRLSIRFRDKEF